MTVSPYWNPRHETMTRDELTGLQVHKLKRLVEWADAKVPWYSQRFRKAGVSSDKIKSLDDLRRIPYLTRDDFMVGQTEEPPFGPFLAAPKEKAIRYHMTSGTTGKTPIRVLDGMKDWESIAENWCYGFWGFGVRPADTVFFAFSYGSFIGFWGAPTGLEGLKLKKRLHVIHFQYIFSTSEKNLGGYRLPSPLRATRLLNIILFYILKQLNFFYL